tara:strand:+ start:12621 stop:14354 length:1734 start_codon:yes stop_codon:yes gene_type:complete
MSNSNIKKIFQEIKKDVNKTTNLVKNKTGKTASSITNFSKTNKDNIIIFIFSAIYVITIIYFLKLRTEKWGEFRNFFPRTMILISVFCYVFSLIVIYFYINKVSLLENNKLYKILILLVTVFVGFFIALLLFKHAIFNTSALYLLLIVLVILATGIYVYNYRNSQIAKMILLFLYTLNCYKNDTLDLINKEFKLGFNNRSYLLLALIAGIVLLSIFIPFLISLTKKKKGIILLSSKKSLNDEILYLTQEEINEKIINSKSFASKKLLKTNKDFEQYLKSVDISDNALGGFNSYLTHKYETDISQNVNSIKEGFNNNIHLLDSNVSFQTQMKQLTKKEKEILDKTMKCNLTSDDFKDGKKIENYIVDLQTDGVYSKLLENISDYNKSSKTNDFINQKSSYLVNMINRAFNINNFNYHYGISFWVYFDPSILTMRNYKDGLIINYSKCPKIYYDYNNSELKIALSNYVFSNDISKLITDDENILMNKENLIYKTKNILFQKWNNFVINYNYGTLDIFINNNLVLTKRNIAPYIKKSFLQLGSSKHPLINCGMCNAMYYEKPLKRGEINKIYKNRNYPCY